LTIQEHIIEHTLNQLGEVTGITFARIPEEGGLRLAWQVIEEEVTSSK
jgi:hypothetical protein